MVGTGGGGCIN